MPHSELFPIQMAVYFAFGVAGTLFFWLNRNVPLKRRLLPFYGIGAGALFLWLLYSMDGSVPVLFAVFAVAIIAVGIRTTQFCEACGRTIMRGATPFTRAKHCPACGHELARPHSSTGTPQ